MGWRRRAVIVPRIASETALLRELERAERRTVRLRSRLMRMGANVPPPRPMPKVEIRIWMDGAFDLMHYGHVNAFRQGRALGTHLVVGVNSDESITKCKGPPVMNDAERLAMIEACKFVDEVVPNVPYIMSDEYVRWVIQAYRIDYVVHGDDPCIVDGRDVYESAVRLGKYRTIPRTEGVSTTEIVGRMLTLTTEHHAVPPSAATPPGSMAPSMTSPLHATVKEEPPTISPLLAPKAPGSAPEGSGRLVSGVVAGLPPEPVPADPLANDRFALDDNSDDSDDNDAPKEPQPPATPTLATAGKPSGAAALPPSFVRESKFMTTSRMLRLFAMGCGNVPAGARVVYVDGGWDMFHAGHVDFLRRARALGDYLLVGVHNDVMVNRHRGSNFPIMNLNERTLSVLSCRYASDVVIDPPWVMTREMIAALGISIVAHGSTNDPNDTDDDQDSYAVPKAMGIYKEIASEHALTVETIVGRLQANQERLRAKVEKKMKAENAYYKERYGFADDTSTSAQ
jgi:cytidyltransferase-like protein